MTSTLLQHASGWTALTSAPRCMAPPRRCCAPPAAARRSALAAAVATPRAASSHSHHRRRRAPQPARASSPSSPSSPSRSGGGPSPGGVRKQLPIFPLGVVPLPHAIVPLMIFEPRYRVLFSTLLAGAPGVDDGLVQEDSPFKGGRTFGMCFVDEKGRLSSVGTALHIEEYVHEDDGRMYVTTRGVERFRITGVAAERPVLIADVETLPEDGDDGEAARAAAAEVADLFRNTLRLHLKMQRAKRAAARGAAGGGAGGGGAGAGAGAGAGLGSQRGDAPAPPASAGGGDDDALGSEPEELAGLAPCQLSYWIAHAFQESRHTQQALLEETSTLARLAREKEVLEATLKFYSAATALEGVFGGGGGGGSEAGSGSGEPVPPPGGPD